MPQPDFEILFDRVLNKLAGLAPTLTYHAVSHTVDVVRQSERIGHDEGVNEKEMYLLKVAALYHDTGFLEIYAGHEEKGCEIFLNDTAAFHFNESDKRIIHDLIMVTKVPQRPVTLLQKILCDADLDYLGRSDFEEISGMLKKEFLHYGIVKDEVEWKNMQLKFIKNHHYHTNSSRLLREPGKKMNYARIH